MILNLRKILSAWKPGRKILIYSGTGIFFLILGILFEINYHHNSYSEKDVRRFESVLHKKEKFLKDEFDWIKNQLESDSTVNIWLNNTNKYQKLAREKGIFIFYYGDDELKYWSDHTIPLRDTWRMRYESPFQVFKNTDYVAVTSEFRGDRILGLIEIRTHYALQNEFLESRFNPDFDLKPDVKIERLESPSTFPVYNLEGRYLFSLDFSGVFKNKLLPRTISVIAYLIFLLLAFIALCNVIYNAKDRRRSIWLVAASLLISGLAILMVKLNLPGLIFESQLFQPELFASRYFNSLGHLMVFALASMMIAILINRYLEFPSIRSARVLKAISIFFLLLSATWFVFICHILRILVIDSNISFETYRVTTFSVYTFVGLFILALFFAVFALLEDKGIKLTGPVNGKNVILILVTSLIAIIVLRFIVRMNIDVPDIVLFMLIVGSQVYLRYTARNGLQFSRIIFLLLFVSLFTVIELQEQNHINTENQMEVELVKLSSEHDPVAEMLFTRLSGAISNDSILTKAVSSSLINIDFIYNWLQRNYFSGYWTKYDILITVCSPEDRVYLQPPDDVWLHCYSFFDTMIVREGMQIEDSDFYFLDNLNGRISYLAAIPFSKNEMERTLFLELDSKIISEELGYPELLLDEDFTSFTNTRFSYAKYNGGQLITQGGDFPYRRTSDYYTDGTETFETLALDHYDHMIYNVDALNTIIVGTPSVSLIDHLFAFSYVFAFYFMLLALFFTVFSIRDLKLVINWNFKNKIQYSMAGILFFTFIIICTGTIIFLINQYKDKHNDSLRSTMRSIYIELIHKVEYEEDLRNWSSDSYYNLDELLIKFSNVFYSDINLYDGDGNLLASSRPEIFDQQLLSTRMNREVYENLVLGNASEYIHTEQIGKLKYLSAYVPLMNSENRLLAYLNLPYFTQAGALTMDVTNLVVAVLNIYMILLLVILLLSVVLADRITQPLRVIQNRIAQVSLSKKNEKIIYERRDEIKGLVEEYNYMVDEIERSAELLAQSERESAWREMAKQIAHEIKNPLTPMKLNIQHLQRTFQGKGKENEIIDKISKTLIEQIDSLSSIANEFSDFAKMPRAKNERINLVTKLKDTLQLFETTDHIEVTLYMGALRKVYITGDREQLMRVFINLIKNSIQSIPETRQGKIDIRLEILNNTHVLITISDNGKGIPEEIKDRLFQPNFTTKSGGMGMGLAISANIIRSFGGEIWYDTVINRGTTFFVKFPLLEEQT